MTHPIQHVAAVLLLLCLCAPVAVAEGDGALDTALKAFKEGRWKDAAKAARAVGGEDENYPKAQYLLGEARLVLGDAVAAEGAFRKVLALRPEAIPAQVGLARALVLEGKPKEALELLATTLKTEPKDVDALRVKGEAHLALGETKKAIAVLGKARKADKKDVMVSRALVEAHVRAEDLGRAAQVAKKLIKVQPNHPMGPFLLGLVLERQGDDDEAIEAYEKALELDDHFLDAHKNLAILCHTMSRTYQDEERVAKAFRHYERYFELGGHDPELEKTYRTTRSFLESR